MTIKTTPDLAALIVDRCGINKTTHDYDPVVIINCEDHEHANAVFDALAALSTATCCEATRVEWQPIETFSEPTSLSSGCGVLVADADGTVGEAYFRNFGDDSDGWWWANTSWGDYPEPHRPIPVVWRPLPEPPAAIRKGAKT